MNYDEDYIIFIPTVYQSVVVENTEIMLMRSPINRFPYTVNCGKVPKSNLFKFLRYLPEKCLKIGCPIL